MSRLIKILLLTVGIVIILILVGITSTIGWRPFFGPRARPLTDRKFESTPARMERGEYLVEGVLGCLDCHSERDPTALGGPPKAGLEGAGEMFLSDTALGTIYASNITPDKEAGIGNWSDDQLARAIREGIGGDGRALFPAMPYQNYRHLPDEDLASVIIFIRSLPPVRKSGPKTQINFPINRLIMGTPQPINEPVLDPDISTPVLRGEHVVRLGSCSDCHTPQDANGQYMQNLAFAGGFPFNGLNGTKLAAPNITQDPSGIPYYDEANFIKMMRNGQIGARKIDAVMPWGVYRNMNDEDLKAVFAFVRTIKLGVTAPVSSY